MKVICVKTYEYPFDDPMPEKGKVYIVTGTARVKPGTYYRGYRVAPGLYYILKGFPPGQEYHSDLFREIDDLEGYREKIENLNLVEIEWGELEKITHS